MKSRWYYLYKVWKYVKKYYLIFTGICILSNGMKIIIEMKSDEFRIGVTLRERGKRLESGNVILRVLEMISKFLEKKEE